MLELRTCLSRLTFSSITKAGPTCTKRTIRTFVNISRTTTSKPSNQSPSSKLSQVRYCSAEVRRTMAPPTDRDILPDTIKPLNYDLSLFNLEFGGEWSYDGLVKIDSKVRASTKEFVINTKELEITGAEVLGKDGGCTLYSNGDDFQY